MPYVTCRLEKLYAMRWTATPVLADIGQLLSEARAARQAVGGGLCLLSVVPVEEIDMPSSEVRETMQVRLHDLMENFVSADAVFEGTGVRGTLIRTVVRGMAMISNTRFEYHFHSRVNEALNRLEPKLQFNRARVLNSLRVNKIVGVP